MALKKKASSQLPFTPMIYEMTSLYITNFLQRKSAYINCQKSIKDIGLHFVHKVWEHISEMKDSIKRFDSKVYVTYIEQFRLIRWNAISYTYMWKPSKRDFEVIGKDATQWISDNALMPILVVDCVEEGQFQFVANTCHKYVYICMFR